MREQVAPEMSPAEREHQYELEQLARERGREQGSALEFGFLSVSDLLSVPG